MSAHEPMFRLDLPGDDEAPQVAGEVVVPFPSTRPVKADEPAAKPKPGAALALRVKPALERTASGWRSAWVGDGVLGMRPRSVADLARQFWLAPPAYVRDALILRIPYAVYGVPVIVASAAAHLLLLVISYPSLLAGTGLLVLFVSLFL